MSKGIEDLVREKYAAVAVSSLTNESSGVQAVAQAFGYSVEELASIPAEANMGLSCGNPTATANLRPGEVVVDLGSGGGIDVLLAARKVGPEGRAIGVDMTDEMLDRARRNAAKAGAENAEFLKGTIDALPLPDASADCIISNCVINLAPDKRAVFQEMARVLRPGGRVAISDIAIKKPLPPEIGQDLLAYVGCIAGAVSIDEYREGLKAAGFAHVEIIDSRADLNAYARIEGQFGCCGGAMAGEPELVDFGFGEDCRAPEGNPSDIVPEASCCSPAESKTPEIITRLAELSRRHDLNAYAASVKVFAVKPR